jgi:hypothetical protein
MKVYSLEIPINTNYAQLRASTDQEFEEQKIDVWWEHWGVTGNEIKDFIHCNRLETCLEEIANELKINFRGISSFKFDIKKTEKEESGNLKKLKYLPKENPNLKFIYTSVEIKLLPQSTVEFEENENGKKYIEEIYGISELRGDLIIPREEGKGFFFSKNDINGYDFFKPINTGFLLCTERVKEFCEMRKYTNVVFLEVGNII